MSAELEKCIVAKMEIRKETAADIAGVWDVQASAFPSHAEADLVTRIRDDGDAVFSLVAVLDEQVIAHALFSRMQAPKRFLCLAPVGVLPSFRRRGIAGCLIRDGLARAQGGGWAGVFVLGDDYYKRFGFDPSLAAGFGSPYAGPHFMLLGLQTPGLTVRTGPARYARAFSGL